jgi:hypothetical protein
MMPRMHHHTIAQAIDVEHAASAITQVPPLRQCAARVERSNPRIRGCVMKLRPGDSDVFRAASAVLTLLALLVAFGELIVAGQA